MNSNPNLYRISIFALIVLCITIVSGCRSGSFWAQNSYFPEGSQDEDEWLLRATVYVGTNPGDRFIEDSDKSYRILIRNKKDEELYSESGQFHSGAIRASIDWGNAELLKIVITTRDGKIIIERLLKYKSDKGLYEYKK